MRWTVGTKIGGGFALALAILIFIGGASYRSTAKLMDTADWVTHTHLVLERLSGLIQALTDAETAQRGFLLTGEDSYLEPYTAASAAWSPVWITSRMPDCSAWFSSSTLV